MMPSRRHFIRLVPWAVAGWGLGAPAHAQMVDEASAQARALGYVADATRADRGKYRQYAPGQSCRNCALWQGKPGDATAGCPLFPRRQVTGGGWCSAYARKP